MSEDYKGYRDPVLSILKRYEAFVWSDVTIRTSKGEFAGLILPVILPAYLS